MKVEVVKELYRVRLNSFINLVRINWKGVPRGCMIFCTVEFLQNES